MTTIDYQLFLKEILPFEDYLFYKPLTQEEVAELESGISNTLPLYYREFLLNFGIYQDLLPGLFLSKEEWIEQNGYLYEAEQNYVMIGDNGGEDFWLLRTDDVQDRKVYNWVDDEIEETGFTFDDFLYRCLNNLKDDSFIQLNNKEKVLRAHLSVSTNQESELIDNLGIELIENWEEEVPNFEDMRDYLKDQQITVYTINAKLNDSLVSIKKECNQKLNKTVYTFDYTETLSVLRANSKMAVYQSIVEEQFSNSSFNLLGIYKADYQDWVW
ncbi:MAG: SMI1/KNR4 family protein [Flavobacteriaceae bacterium]|jgi:hypothetical protein|nr:SMI1/KNR4 family protein [Flavobacteriaceae bacterium]